MTLQAFVDDSGGKGQGKALVLAGLSASAEQWALFSEDWDRQLRAAPSIHHFKLSDATRLNNEFYGWREEARDQKVAVLSRVLSQHRPRLTYCVIGLRPFDELITQRLSAPVAPNTANQPYLFALHVMLQSICADAFDTGHRSKMAVIFDNHDIFCADAKREYERLRNDADTSGVDWKSVLPVEPWFRDDHDFKPLQAADLIAGLLRRHNSLDDWAEKIQFDVPVSPLSIVYDRPALQRFSDKVIATIERLTKAG